MMFTRQLLAPLFLLGALAPLSGATLGPQAEAAASDDSPSRVAEPRELEPYQLRLLEVAMQSASAFPLEPHIKNRSRAQEGVVQACLELDQPERGLRYAEQIANWRCEGALADYAYYRAELGETEGLESLLERTAAKVQQLEQQGDQAWRRDRLRAKLARVYLLLDQGQRAASFAAGIESSEFGPVAVTAARLLDEAEFEKAVAAQTPAIELGDFEQMRGTMYMFAELFGRFYDDPERRAQSEEQVRLSWRKLPLDLRIDFLLKLADHALAHGDQPKALQLVDEAQSFTEGVDWLPRHLVPLLGRLSGYRFRAGDTARAEREADNALALYLEKREQLPDIFRAETLVPIAESYQVMGATDDALKVYRLAIEEGGTNPNARPRAEDLAATCCSMARHEVEPDEALWERIAELREGLVAPW
jgi:hypothetical protein